MDLTKIGKHEAMPYFMQPRTDCQKPAANQEAQQAKKPDLTSVAHSLTRYTSHIETHRALSVDFHLNVGAGKGVEGLDLEAVAKAKADPAFSELNSALEGFSSLNENQRNMIYAAGAFLKDKDENGYKQLVDFVKKSKDYAAQNPGTAFAMDFKFQSSQDMTVDLVAEREEYAQANDDGSSSQATRVQMSRKIVMSSSFKVSGILTGLGQVLGDLQAGLVPEEAAAEPAKPADATSLLMEALKDHLEEPLKASQEVPLEHQENDKDVSPIQLAKDEQRIQDKKGLLDLTLPPATGPGPGPTSPYRIFHSPSEAVTVGFA